MHTFSALQFQGLKESDFPNDQDLRLEYAFEAFRSYKGDIATALQTAATNRDLRKSSKIGPAVQWVGWLSRNNKSFAWEVSRKADTSLAGGTRLCVFQRSTPTSPPTMVDVATVTADGMVTVLKRDGASAIEGRPVFQILDKE